MKKLKIGIVGLGRVASATHIPVLKTLSNVEVIAGVEKNQERAKRVKELFGIERVYSDYEEMYVSENLDGVYICLPNFLHMDACIKAINHRIHVLCEKPFGVSVSEARKIVNQAEQKGVIVIPGYKKRYARNFKKAKRMVEEEVLGKIIHVQGTFLTPGPYISWDPKSDWYLDKKWHGVIYDVGCHLVDLLLYLVPYKVTNVKLVKQKGLTGYNTPTNVACVFEMEEGTTGDLAIGWRAATDIISLSLHGTAGSLTVSRDYFAYVNAGTDPIDRIKMSLENVYSECNALIKKIWDKTHGRNFYEEDLIQAQTFCRSISGLETPPIHGNDAIKIHQFLEKMIVSG